MYESRHGCNLPRYVVSVRASQATEKRHVARVKAEYYSGMGENDAAEEYLGREMVLTAGISRCSCYYTYVELANIYLGMIARLRIPVVA